jgi:hypothetical protein
MPRYENFLKVLFFLSSAASSAFYHIVSHFIMSLMSFPYVVGGVSHDSKILVRACRWLEEVIGNVEVVVVDVEVTTLRL